MSTLYYPQLTTGSVAQYPVSRSWSQAAIVNTLPGGSSILMAVQRPARASWQLTYNGLSDAEWNGLQNLFTQAGGRLNTFTFLDPTDNLLSWSEDFTQSTWSADPLLSIVNGAGDPQGGSAALQLTNAGQAAQQVSQGIAGPSWYQYCFSIYLRTDGPCIVNLVRSSTSSATRQAVAVRTNWNRVVMQGANSPQEDGIRFGIELPAGATVCAFGAQAEVQPSAGLYKARLNRSGVYVSSRFDQDSLVQTAVAPRQYSTTIQITSNY